MPIAPRASAAACCGEQGFGLGMRVVTDAAARGTWLSQGSFGWSGVYG
jgi:hypothetical protein